MGEVVVVVEARRRRKGRNDEVICGALLYCIISLGVLESWHTINAHELSPYRALSGRLLMNTMMQALKYPNKDPEEPRIKGFSE